MKNLVTLSLVGVLFAPMSCKAPGSNVPEAMLLTGAVVYDGNGGRMGNASVRIEDGRISCVGDCPVKDSDKVMDMSGKFITPGMIDAHVHFFQTGFFDSRPDAMDLREKFPTSEVYAYQARHPDRYYNAYLGSGITGVYDVGGMDWSILLQFSAETDPSAPHVAAAGALITPVPEEYISIFNMPTSQVMRHLENGKQGREVVKYNSDLGSTGIKIWLMAPDDPAFREAMLEVKEEIERQGNKLIIHANTLKEAKMAVEMGAKLLVHSVTDTLVDHEFLSGAQETGTYYNPTLIVSKGYQNTRKAVLGEEFDMQDPRGLLDEKTRELLMNAHDHVLLVDTALLRERLARSEYGMQRTDSIMAENLRRVHEAGIRIVVGTDAGNPGTLHGVSIFNELEAMQNAGIPAPDLIVMATRNGAEAMERGDDFGTVEAGKMADLVILGKDPGIDITNMRSVEKVMRAGKFWQKN